MRFTAATLRRALLTTTALAPLLFGANSSAWADGGKGGFGGRGGVDQPTSVGANGNADPAGGNAGGGGGAGVTGGTGGDGLGSIGGQGAQTAGGNGSDGTAGTTGAGGGGGAHGAVAPGLPTMARLGGNGGNGGNGTANNGGGGGGGAGGFGAVVTGNVGGTLGSAVTGGIGGSAGSGANSLFFQATGGSGGVGLYFASGASGATFTLNANVRGGTGGNGNPAGNATIGGGGDGGTGVFGAGIGVVVNGGVIVQGGNGGNGQSGGLGGIGILGSNLTIDNRGIIAGGLPGTIGTNSQVCGSETTTLACAIQFTGGTNFVGTGGTINGGVNVVGGSFQPALNTEPVGTTLGINGPLIFALGTTFNIRITPTVSDSVTSTSANLGGAGVNVAAGAGTYAARQYTILTAAAGFGATRFGAVTTNLAFLNPTLTYDATNDNVFLNIAPNSGTFVDYRGAAVTQNQFNFASALTNGGTLAGGNNPILTGFNQLSVAQAQAAFDSLTGEGITAAQNAAFTASRLFTSSIADQILLVGGAPNSVIVPTGPNIAPLGYSAVQALPTPIRVRDPILSRPLYSWRAWGSGYGASQTINANSVLGNAQQSIGIGGGSVGVDYTWAQGMLTGIALGGSDGSFNVGARQTSGSTTGGHAAWYTLAEFGNIYATSTTSVSVFGNRTTRTIGGFGGLNGEILRGNFTSTEVRSRVEFGYRFGITPGVTFTPFYAVEAAKLRSDGFTETPLAGAGVFALNLRGQSASSVPMFFGARLTGAFDVGNGMWLRPSVQAAYVAEFAPVRNQIAGLVNLPGAVFLTDGARPARAAVQVKAGGELALLDNVALSANFDGEFSNRSNTYAGKGAVKIRW